MFVAFSCALAVGWLQPPPSPQRPSESMQPVQQPADGGPRALIVPSQGPGSRPPMMPGHASPQLGHSQFGTGVFPLGATYVTAEGGSLAVETLATETMVRTATRQVPVQGSNGQTQYRNEQYTVNVPVFKSIKRTLPPGTKVYRNGRELSQEEWNDLRERTPIFIAMMGSPNAAPGQGYEKIIGDHLVAFIPPTPMGMPPGGPGMGSAPGITPTLTPRPTQPMAVAADRHGRTGRRPVGNGFHCRRKGSGRSRD